MSLRVWIHGISGRMGSELQRAIVDQGKTWELLGGTSSGALYDATAQTREKDWTRLGSFLRASDLLIDFSAADANQDLLKALRDLDAKDISLLIGTTGLTPEQKSAWKDFAKARRLRLLLAPNTSLGVLLTLKVSQLIAGLVAPLSFDIEVLETHHRAKIDAPSGTAKFLAQGIAANLGKTCVYGREGKRGAQEIGIASLRGGSVFGEHDVRFLGDHEEITISHRALDRRLFAEGAMHLARWLIGQDPGSYGLEDVGIEDMAKLLRK